MDIEGTITGRTYPTFMTGNRVAPPNVGSAHTHSVQMPNPSGVPVTHHTSGTQEINTAPVNSEVDSIATSIAKEIALQTDNRVQAILEDGGKDEWIAWFQSEVEHWKQRAEELEIELECMRNAFPEDDNDVRPKVRGIF
jgi:hypothetical protein